MKLIFSHLFSPGIISHIRRLSILFLLAMIFATGIGTTRAVHASERFAVMVDEIYDGVKQESETIESFISEHLVQKGFQVADREQTLQLRKNVATADLLKGRLPDTVFSFEADYLVAGKADCEVFSTDTMGVPFKSAKCNLTLKLIQVDSGQYIGSFSEDDIAMDISKRTACRKSALQLAKQFVAKTLPKLQKRGQKSKLISLWLYDLAQRSDMDGLLAGIKAITTVSDAELRHFGKDVCKVDVKLKSGDGFKFSNALEQAAGLSLAVEQASKALVKVRYDLTKTAGLKLSVTPFKNLTRNSRYDWLKSSGAKVFASTLSNSKYIAVDANIKRRKQIPRNKRGLENTIQLVASGKFSGRSENGTLVVEIRDLSTNALFYTATSNGQLENLFSMASDTARQVDKDLLEQIKKKGLSRKYRISAGNLQKLDGYLSVIKETRFLKIKDVEVENIFPAFQARYVGKSLGKVVLANLGSRAAKDVKLQVEIPGFTKLPHETRMEQVAKGKRVEIPLNLSLDRNKVFSLDENTPAQMKVSLTYVVGDRELKDTFIKPVLIYDRNALSWQNDGAVAAFITPRDPAVKDFARQAISMAPERNKDKEKIQSMVKGLQFPMAVFNALATLPVKYVKDPVNPSQEHSLDYVQYPRETLKYKTGDCDDMSVLYASMLESLGINTMLVLTPGHILMAFDTGLGKNEAEKLSWDKDQYLQIGSKIWLPIEATKMSSSFYAAWQEGAREVSRWTNIYGDKSSGKVSIIPVAKAWQEYPAVSLPAGREVVAFNINEKSWSKKQSTDLKKWRQNNNAYLTKMLKQLKGKDDPRSIGRQCQLLAKTGRLKDAKKNIQKGLQKHNHNPGLLNNLANVSFLAGNMNKAIGEFNQAFKISGSGSDNKGGNDSASKDSSSSGNNVSSGNSIQAVITSNLAIANFVKGAEKQALKWMKKSVEYGAEPFLVQMGLSLTDNGMRGTEKNGRAQLKFDLAMLMNRSRQALSQAGQVKSAAANKPRSLGGRRGTDASDQELRNNQEIMALLVQVKGDLAGKTGGDDLKDAQARRPTSSLGGRRGADTGTSTKTLLKQDLMILMLKAQKQLPEDLTKYGIKRKSNIAGRRGADPSEMKDVSGFLGWW